MFLSDLSRTSLGGIPTTYYFTHDSTNRSRWEILQAEIEPAIKQIKISGYKIDCYQYTLKTQNKINLGGKYTLGEPVIWVAHNSGKPVKVKVTLYWKFFPVAIITGELN